MQVLLLCFRYSSREHDAGGVVSPQFFVSPAAAVGSEVAVVDASQRDLSNIAGPFTLRYSISTLHIARQLLQAFPLKDGHIQRPCQNLRFAFGRYECLVFSSRVPGRMGHKSYVSSSSVSALWHILLQELHRKKSASSFPIVQSLFFRERKAAARHDSEHLLFLVSLLEFNLLSRDIWMIC